MPSKSSIKAQRRTIFFSFILLILVQLVQISNLVVSAQFNLSSITKSVKKLQESKSKTTDKSASKPRETQV